MGVAEQFSGQKDRVSLFGRNNLLGLSRLGDHADSAGGNPDLIADCRCERGLESRSGRDDRIRRATS